MNFNAAIYSNAVVSINDEYHVDRARMGKNTVEDIPRCRGPY